MKGGLLFPAGRDSHWGTSVVHGGLLIVGHAESNQGFSIDGRRLRVNVRGGWCLKAALYDATDAVFGDFLLAAIKTGCRG